MPAPFVIFSLPRSRSTWTSVFLSQPGALCGHDIGPTLDAPEEFAVRLRTDLAGTCETGAAFAWKLIREYLPEARFAVIRRDPDDVLRSLRAFGILDQDAEMHARAAQLAAISAQPSVLTVAYPDLAYPSVCAELYSHCLDREMPKAWWAHLAPINIQVDVQKQLELLQIRAAAIAAVKAKAREAMADA